MENETNMEMSTLDDVLPKYYKGYDIDILLDKLDRQQPLTKEEGLIFDEVHDIYYKKFFEENEKRWAKIEAEARAEGMFFPSPCIRNPFLEALDFSSDKGTKNEI